MNHPNDMPADTDDVLFQQITGLIIENRNEDGVIDIDGQYETREDIIQLIHQRDAARGKEAAQRLQSRIARYGDGQIVYFNSEAVVPVSAVLAELSTPTDQKEKE